MNGPKNTVFFTGRDRLNVGVPPEGQPLIGVPAEMRPRRRRPRRDGGLVTDMLMPPMPGMQDGAAPMPMQPPMPMQQGGMMTPLEMALRQRQGMMR